MKMLERTTITVFLLATFAAVSGGAYQRFCHFASWHNDRLGLADHSVSHVDANLCSHLLWSFATFDHFKKNTTVPEFIQTTDLKDTHPHLKVLLSIGGVGGSATKFNDILLNSRKRAEFIDDTITTLRRNRFDGLDLGLGSSLVRAARPEVKQELSLLLKEMRAAYDVEANRTGKPRLQLVIAMAQHQPDVINLFDVKEVARWVDFIVVTALDLHRYASRPHITAHHTPLYEPNWTGTFGTITNINYLMTFYIRSGAPAYKLVLQVATYARAFNLSDPDKHGVGAPIKGPSSRRDYSGEDGVLSYHEVCEVLQKEGGTEVLPPDLQAPYLYTRDLWAGYDNPDSLRNKVRWLRKLGLGGYAVWEIGLDDVNGTCGQGPYPLLTALSEELLNGTEPPLNAPHFLTANKSGPCVNKSSGYDCDTRDPFVYHLCTDGLVVYSGSCDSWDTALLFAIGVGQCVSIDEFQQHVICDKTQDTGYPPEYGVMRDAGFPGIK